MTNILDAAARAGAIPTRKRPLTRHQRHDVSAPGFGREHELQEVIAGIEARLMEIARIETREYDDDQLAVIEADAAPYAVAFVYEIRRLERLLAQQRITARLGKMRRRNRQRHATVTGGEHEV